MIFQQLQNGLILGMLYALVSVGYSITFGTLRIIDLAYGSCMMVGAMSAAFAHQYLGGGIVLAIVASAVGAISSGLIVHLVAVKPLGNVADVRSSAHLAALVTTACASLVIQNCVLLALGPNDIPFPTLLNTQQRQTGPLRISESQIGILGLSAISIFIVWYLIKKTAWGLKVRCCSDSPEVAASCGINEPVIRIQLIILASLMAGVGGFCLGLLDRSVTPYTGAAFGLKAVVAVIAGGMGKISGVVVAAIVLGISEVLAVVFLGQQFRDGFAYLALLLILLVRPGGVFSSKRVRY